MSPVALAAIFVVMFAAGASAQPLPSGPTDWAQSAVAQPPPVRGLSVAEARKVLLDWNKNVVIQLVPQALPAGVDESTVVAVTATELTAQQTPGASANRPVVRLALGAQVPDLIGMTPQTATEALAARGLRLPRSTAAVDPSFVVTSQQVPAGSIVDFGFSVPVTFAAPETGPSTVVIASAVALGVLLLALAAFAIRSVRRRNRRGRPQVATAVLLHSYPGQTVGPDLVERAESVSVRLEPHVDPGTVTLEEVPR